MVGRIQTLDDFDQIAQDVYATNYLAIASVALLAYDHVITIKQEINLMWRSRWSVTKIVYVWNRYFALLTLSFNASIRLREITSDASCGASLQLLGGCATIIVSTVDFVLMLRVWILYGRPRILLYIIIPLIIGEVVGLTIIEALTVMSLDPYIHAGPTITGCFSLIVPQYFAFYPIPPLIITSIMFVMTAYKCGQTLYGYRRTRMPIVSLFLRDGVFWFLAVFAVGLPQMILTYVGRATLSEVMIGPSLAVYSVIASRALLNIKHIMSSHEYPDATLADSMELPSLQFRSTGRTGQTWITSVDEGVVDL
ncbi:hypothetical protein BDQ12DRAFT_715370 [Crucibulum laeve]|uniref:DUF6533 domain-containing protein n=1 Tax=Crucibulum laeve TaxID=68775 RepID=A0A5C3LQN7_9AGAR|nr:hypothetical protein BDQ12DRAFT_715370 [Crucibulum laeve]